MAWSLLQATAAVNFCRRVESCPRPWAPVLEDLAEAAHCKGGYAQLRPIEVATQASLPYASASSHHGGAYFSVTRWLPAAIAAATRASAWSCGTEMSTWMRLRCGRGASNCWN